MKHLFFTLLSFFVINSYGQEIIATSGNYFENSDISITWTIGEPVTETVSNGNNILTQGFHQTKLTVSGIFNSDNEISVNIYPNPVDDFVNLKTKNDNIVFELSDINGKILETKKINSGNNKISFSKYSPSIYFLKIYDENNIVKIFKIIKH